MPRVRCMWYDENGAPRERGCTRPNCDFVHPSDPGWFDAPPSRQTVYARSGGHGPGSGAGPHHGIPTGPRAGKRKHTDDAGRGWNQTGAADAGGPVDDGWGGSKRNNSSWGDSGASGTSGVPTGWGASDASKTSTSGSGWGSGTAWGSTDTSAAWGSTDTGSAWGNTDTSSAWGSAKQAETASGGGGSEATGTAGAGANWGTGSSWGNVGKSENSGTVGGSTDNDGVVQPTTASGDAGKDSAWSAASGAGDVVDKGKGKEKDSIDTRGSGAYTSGGWGSSNGNGGWGPTESSIGGSGWQGTVDTTQSTPKPHNTDTSISRAFDQPTPVQPQALTDPSRVKIKLPTTVPGGDNGGWGRSTIFGSGRESREPGELVEEPDGQGNSGWIVEPAASDNVQTTRPAALVKEDIVPVGLPFGASTASFIDDTDWSMRSNDTTPSKTEAHAPNRSRTSSDAYSRPVSPCDSLTMSRKPSVRDYVKALTRAVQYCQDSNNAKEELAKVKRMEASPVYKQVGERGADILRKTSKAAEHKIRSSRKRLDDALEVLGKFPAASHLPSSSVPDEDVEALCAYAREALAWIESVRPTIEDMRTEDITKDEVMLDPQPTEPLPLPSSSSDGVKIAALLEKLEGLEARLSVLEDDQEHLEEDRKAFIQQQIDERIPLGQPVSDAGPSGDLQPRFETLSQAVKGLKEDVPELKQEVETLKRQQADELQRLRAEHNELRGKHVQLEAEVQETKQRISTFADEIQSLRSLMEEMSVTPAAPPPPLKIEPLSLGEWLRPFVVEPIEREIGNVVFGMRQDVEQTLAKSQEDLCKGVWTQLEPALKIMHAVHDTAEKARQNMDGPVLSTELS